MLLAILIPIDLLVIVAFAFTPYVTRKTELFGVTIPADKTNLPELMALRAAYRNQMLVVGAVLIIASIALAILLGPESPLSMTLYMVLVFAYILLGFLLYLPKYFKMRTIEQDYGWNIPVQPVVAVADTKPAASDVISSFWLLLFPLIILLSLAGLALIWPQLPAAVATHFGTDGAPDSFTPKGPRLILLVLLPQVFMALVISLVYFIVRSARRQTDAANPKLSRFQDSRYRRAISIFLVAVGAFSLLFIGSIQLFTMNAQGDILPFLMTTMVIYLLVVLAGTFYLMFAVGQGGSRLRAPKEPSVDAMNVNDDRRWILGQFYYNPEDPAVFVEKRFGVGYTSNFARPLTWVIIVGFLILVAALLIVTFQLSGT